MTRVFGRIFEDGRCGVLGIKPSRPFFGADKYERHYPVINGEIDIELTPTPAGVYYNVGFKDDGDIRDTIFTLMWRIPNTGEVNLTRSQDPKSIPDSGKDSLTAVSNRRLAGELAEALAEKLEIQAQLEQQKQIIDKLSTRIKGLEKSTEGALSARDKEIATLRQATEPIIKKVYERIPVPPKPLQERINFLEAENKRLTELNDIYYKSVLELHQLKLDRAQTASLPQTVEDIPDNPRARLIQKLRAK
jgi:hypothetical protein